MARGYPDYEGEKSKLYSGADWSALEAYDVNFTAIAANRGFGFGALVIYLVPAAQTLYLTQVSFASYATLAADGDNNQICVAHIQNATTGIFLHRQGGNGGGAAIFNKPIVILGGQTVNIYVNTYANHNCDVRIHAAGYLI